MITLAGILSEPEHIPFDRSFDAQPGSVQEVMVNVRRIVAPNPGPFTFTGTNSYIVGRGEVALIDPGPDNTAHRKAIEQAIAGERLVAIVVTHTHRDHSPLARPLAEASGATVYGFGPHQPARPLGQGEVNALDASGDADFLPDVPLGDGDGIEGPDWRLNAIHTPGHTSNHICLSLEGTGTLFSGDHVMAWSTTIVAPPDGRMSDYMASLERLRERDDRLYLPGHGGELEQPGRFVRALSLHRRQRESSILRRLESGDRTIAEMVAAIYQGLDIRLIGAAGLSVLAHLEDLVERGLVRCDGAPGIDAIYERAAG